ncbi:hypothetical protein [Smaragdicoccus niigatensis]|uniref:hypothetical protein n=1 Tax=Smaragdicoccus niigatensis TaxID=359359 RepID=UPI0003802C7B|nr:hypothetical protein [Smaragdicoccus niigatensis]
MASLTTKLGITTAAIAAALLGSAGVAAADSSNAATHSTTTSSGSDGSFSYTQTDKTVTTSPNSSTFTTPGRTPTYHDHGDATLTYTDPGTGVTTVDSINQSYNTTLNYPGAAEASSTDTVTTTNPDGTTTTTHCVSHFTDTSAEAQYQQPVAFSKCN